MYESFSDVFFWIIPFFSALIMTIVLSYFYCKDKRKEKIIFILAFGTASIGYLHAFFKHIIGIMFLEKSYRWSFMPVAVATNVAAFSSLPWLSFKRQFKGFLFSVVFSIFMLIIPVNSDTAFLYSFIFVSTLATTTLAYLAFKRHETSDLMFLMSFLCIVFSVLAKDVGLVEEHTVLLGLFGTVFIGLMFRIVTEGDVNGIASFVVLKKKLKEVQEDLKTTQEKLLKAERLAIIGHFAAMVGHDLRNPLTSIKGATYYFKRKYNSKMDDKGKEMLETVERAIEYSNKIVNDLLEYSGEIKLELTKTNPKSLVKETLRHIKVPISIEIIDKTQDQPMLEVDEEKMERTFINMIKNALDSMPNGGRLSIESELAGNNVVFRFKDTGMGMTKETLQKLWTPLFTTKATGMGFGLSICKRIVEAHGGKITAESVPRKGSTFIVELPLEPKPEQIGQKIYLSTPELMQKTDFINIS